MDVLGTAVFAGESKEVTTPHIEAGEEGGERTNDVEERPEPGQVRSSVGRQSEETESARVQRLGEDLVFREKAADRNNAGNCYGCYQEGIARRRHVLAQSAHPLHVLLAVQAVDHRARAEEQTGLEEGVRDQVHRAGEER